MFHFGQLKRLCTFLLILLFDRLDLLLSVSLFLVDYWGKWFARRNTARPERIIVACWMCQLRFWLCLLDISIKEGFSVGCEQLFMRAAHLKRLFLAFVYLSLGFQSFLWRRALDVLELFVFLVIDLCLWTDQDIWALRDNLAIWPSIIFSSFFGVRLTHIFVRCFNPK